MAKKKMTRDTPLPSSDGMFGGPGDPKKKYTTSDSAQFAQTYGRMEQNAQKLKQYQKNNPQTSMGGGFGVGRDFPEQTRNQMFSQLDSLERNPYMSTAVERTQKTGQPFKRKK